MLLDGSFRAGGEDIWVAVLRREVRICGWWGYLGGSLGGGRGGYMGGEDIWVAVLGRKVRIFGCQFWGCHPRAALGWPPWSILR